MTASADEQTAEVKTYIKVGGMAFDESASISERRWSSAAASYAPNATGRFGSLATLQNSTILTAACGRIADVNRAHFDENQWAPFLSLLSATVPWTW